MRSLGGVGPRLREDGQIRRTAPWWNRPPEIPPAGWHAGGRAGPDRAQNQRARPPACPLGSPLPPDLVDAAPSFAPRAEAGELVTLIDMDHFVEGNFDADPDWVVARACEMSR